MNSNPKLFESTDSYVNNSANFLDKLPQVISKRFEVKELIGRGGVGVVLKCRDNVLNNIYAVKLLLNNVSDAVAARFQREAITAAKLNHRNIVRVVDFGQNDDGRLFLVMEYLEGGTLLDEIRQNGPYDLKDALPVILKIADGLIHAHHLGVVHRDVKPSNVMLAREPNGKIVPKLVDFGLARLHNKSDQQVTTGSRLMGSPSYLSPEVAKGLEVDFRTDVYSLGCLIFETLAGEPPFLGESAFETLNKKLNQPAPTLYDKTGLRFPHALEETIARCLAVSPDERFSSVEEVKESLEQLYELEEFEEEDEESDEIKMGDTLVLSPDKLPYNKVPRKLKYENVLIFIALLIACAITIFCVFLSLPAFNFGDFGNSNPPAKTDALIQPETTPVLKKIRYKDSNFMSFKDGSITDVVEAVVENKRSIRAFQIRDRDLTGYSLKKLSLTNLKALSLKSCVVNDFILERFSEMSDLDFLDLEECEGFSDRGIKHLKNLKGLKRLELPETKVGDVIFEVASELPLLEYLSLRDCRKIKGVGLEKLADLPNLKALLIGGANFEHESIPTLEKLTGLRRLSLYDAPFSDDDLKYITSLPLTKLYLNKVVVSDKGVDELAKLKNLNELVIIDCIQVTADGVKKLEDLLPNCVVKTKSHL